MIKNNILLTGPPRIGKTTIIKKVIEAVDFRCAGFYTREIRDRNKRVGFMLQTLDNKECVLSHITQSGPRVGKYGVDLTCIERVGVSAIEKGITHKKGLIIIDEIGKMELFSTRFRSVALKALDSEIPVLGTILLRPEPFCDRIKARDDVEIIEVTFANRNILPEGIVARLT
ncbi:hypothetical protein BXT86_02705 [candidate division WOR-3 bacterium 4484_100]|uniref:AAA+ ATPase domain-containing protein n=1 Tax=candidate division WOR-3 bacterium 4484_100 TaxID=1936077 RepID=A0A1V4QH20_UNCW3|nr:MAG: hypothetical protein BXT86_02705 [candidate division WOR-3 bacterium 4484_100]